MKRIVIKIGTNVLTDPQGLLDLERMESLCNQISELRKSGLQIVLVSSGAVGAGMSMVNLPPQVNRVVRRQVLAAVGQIKLMEVYARFFGNHGFICAQVLATKEDFRDRSHYLNMQSCFEALLRDEIIPVVNENDVTSVSELMFTDNDELAGFIAAMINADQLIILTNVDGIFSGNPENPDSKLITSIDPDDRNVIHQIQPSKSRFGRGGMLTKFRMSSKLGRAGISTIIANGKKADILVDIMSGNYTGTCIQARKKLSRLKKWMAFNVEAKPGRIIINKGAEQALCSSEKVSSLLFVGVTQIQGSFKKGDLVIINNEEGDYLGTGKAQFPSGKAKKFMGQKGKKPLIHYDYLYVD